MWTVGDAVEMVLWVAAVCLIAFLVALIIWVFKD